LCRRETKEKERVKEKKKERMKEKTFGDKSKFAMVGGTCMMDVLG
jgi:hypothetical protein